MSKAPVSMVIIVKNDPHIEDCIKSIRDYVAEIVVVDTGSDDGITPAICKKYADKFEVYTECNGKNPNEKENFGKIIDFSMARNRAFSLATQNWVLWGDSDDIIEGGENLIKLTSSFSPNANIDDLAFMFPYEYSYDQNGKCTCRHYRERLFSNKNHFHWVNPVHEVAVINDGFRVQLISDDSLTFKHRRQYSNKPMESGRNLRILKKYVEGAGKDDARQMYYIGLEYYNNGFVKEALDSLTHYIDISGWDDERIMACLKLVDIYHGLSQYQEALKWAFKAVELGENWAEGYLAVGRMFYFIAQSGGHNQYRNWQRCIHFIRIGLSMPPTKTLLFINPVEREFEIFKYLNVALNSVGDVQGALESANEGLKSQQDPMLLGNKKLYEKFLATQQIANSLNILKDIESIDDASIKTILAIMNNSSSELKLTADVNGNTFPPYKKSPTYPRGIAEDQFPVAIITPHAQAWGIPNVLEIDDLPLRMTKEQLQAAVIMIWRQYILHDELLAANSFLENAPYDVRDTKITQDALAISQKMMNWLKDPTLMQKHNAPSDPNTEIDVPMPGPLSQNQSGGRFNFVKESLPNHKVSIVDFGCVDGCFTNRYGMMGHEVLGLDVVETSVDLANKKAKEFNTGAKHIVTYFQDAADKVPNDYFDYATSTDTYEHLMDPVNDMLIPARKMLHKNGKFLLCTPFGSWFRGNYVSWGHPWLWEKEGHSWLWTHPHGHLVAPSSWSVAKHFKEAGYYVYNSYAKPTILQNVPDQGNVFAEAHMQFPKNSSGLDIVFYIGQGVEDWTPQSVKVNGIGGSELMAIEMSKRLAKQGHRVRIYNSCGKYGEGIYEGVEYYHTEKYQDLKCDVLIVSRVASFVNEKFNIEAKLKLLWVHDVFALNASSDDLRKYDKILALSEWHKQNIINVHQVRPDQVIVTRNGIDLNRFQKNVTRNKYKVVNSSSPDRHLPVLLDVWSEIKKRVPQATLDIFYGFKNWEYVAQHDPNQMALINRLKAQMEALKSDGVNFRDRVSQEKLAEEFLSAGVWAYSTCFSETSCISAMEAQAAGLRIITSPIAALNETVGTRGTLIPGEWTTPEYKNKFVDAVVSAMHSDNNTDRVALQEYAKNFDLDSLSQDWEKMFTSLIIEKTENPLVAYSDFK
jgi:glycosyltransferase involved in cell wall biosynthesis/2-polyprenyl-3-methyl-5-hydroxy-6-metoxy-1,4-benzoquinol methylase